VFGDLPQRLHRVKEDLGAGKPNKLLNLLTASVTHELQTPLNCIVQIVNNIVEKTEDETLHKSLKQVELSAKLMSFNVRDLLDRSMLENGKLTLNVVNVCLKTLIKQVIELAKTQANFKHIKI
jgi:signal transduction histidine kinase